MPTRQPFKQISGQSQVQGQARNGNGNGDSTVKRQPSSAISTSSRRAAPQPPRSRTLTLNKLKPTTKLKQTNGDGDADDNDNELSKSLSNLGSLLASARAAASSTPTPATARASAASAHRTNQLAFPTIHAHTPELDVIPAPPPSIAPSPASSSSSTFFHPSPSSLLSAKLGRDGTWTRRQERLYVQWINSMLTSNGSTTNNSPTHSTHTNPSAPLSSTVLSRLRAACLSSFHSSLVSLSLRRINEEIDCGRLTLRESAWELGMDVESRQCTVDIVAHHVHPAWIQAAIEAISGISVNNVSQQQQQGQSQSEKRQWIEKLVQEYLFPSSDNTVLPPPATSSIESGDAYGGAVTTAGMDAATRTRCEQVARQSEARDSFKRFLTLLLTLDIALQKMHESSSSTPTDLHQAGVPSLFLPSEEGLYSTMSLLDAFCTRFLSSGEWGRQLRLVGFVLSYDESSDVLLRVGGGGELRVKSLGADLRDGVRLGRMAEVIAQRMNNRHANGTTWGGHNVDPLSRSSAHQSTFVVINHVEIISQMRVPANTMEKKVHNVSLVLQTLRSLCSNNPPSNNTFGSQTAQRFRNSSARFASRGNDRLVPCSAPPSHPFNISADSIACGDQLTTHLLLREMQLRFDVHSMLDTTLDLGSEIQRIKSVHQRTAESLPRKWRMGTQQENLYFGPSQKVQVLMTWFQTVLWAMSVRGAVNASVQQSTHHPAQHHHHPSSRRNARTRIPHLLVENLSACLRSGAALALLISYYRPDLIPSEHIAHPKRPSKDKRAWHTNDEEEGEEEEEKNDASESKENDHAQGQDPGKWVMSFSFKEVFTKKDPLSDPESVASCSGRNFSMIGSAMEKILGGVKWTSLNWSRCIRIMAGQLDRNGGNGRVRGDVNSMVIDDDDTSGMGCPTPSEGAMVGCLFSLASTFLLSSPELHATFVIQRSVRRWLRRTAAKRAREERLRAITELIEANKCAQEAMRRREEAIKMAQAKEREERLRLEAKRKEQMEAQERAAKEAAERKAAQERARIVHETQSKAALVIQSAFRGRMSRKLLKLLRAEAKAARLATEEAEKERQRRVHAAIRLQSIWRMKLARRQLIRLRARAAAIEQARRSNAALHIQCLWRMHQSKRLLKQLQMEERARQLQRRTSAALSIQCCWRQRIARRILSRLREAEAERRRQERFQRIHAATIIQCCWRRVKAQRQLRMLKHVAWERRRRKWAATKIQSLARGRIARLVRKQLAQDLQRRIHAATTIQSHWRGMQTRRWFTLHKARMLKAIIIVQAAFRGKCARIFVRRLREQREKEKLERMRCATIIQCAWRSHRARLVLQELKKQEAARRESLRRLAACIKIQSHFRAHVARKIVSELREAHRRNRASIRIQSMLRTWMARRLLDRLRIGWRRWQLQRHEAAIRMQCAFRGKVARRRLSSLRRQAAEAEVARRIHASQTIQHAYRCHLARIQLSLLRAAREEARVRQTRMEAAIVVQCALRCHRARSVVASLRKSRVMKQHAAAVTIQCFLRRTRARRHLSTLRAQAEAARMEAQRIEQERTEAATRIQAQFRTWAAVKELKQLKQVRAQEEILARRTRAAIRIQSAFRSLVARRIVAKLKERRAEEMARIETVRQKQMKQQLEVERREAQARAFKRNRSARIIAAAWHRYTSSESYLSRRLAKQHGAAILIQAVIRGWMVRRLAQRRRAAIIVVQKIARGWIIRKQIERVKKMEMTATTTTVAAVAPATKQTNKMDKKSALKSSASSTAITTSSTSTAGTKPAPIVQASVARRLISIRTRLRKTSSGRRAGAGVGVGVRTQTALEHLLVSSSLTGLLQSMQTLASTTAALPACARDAVDSRAMPALTRVLRGLNRSQPHLLLAHATLHVINNLAMEPTTRHALLEADDDLVDPAIASSSSPSDSFAALSSPSSLLSTLLDGLYSSASASTPILFLRYLHILHIGVAMPHSTWLAYLHSSRPTAVAAMKRLGMVKALMLRKKEVEMKAANHDSSAGVKRTATSTTKQTKAAMAASSSSFPSAQFNPDSFQCACHGRLGSSTSTNGNTSSSTTAQDKLRGLGTCSDHIQAFIAAIQA